MIGNENFGKSNIDIELYQYVVDNFPPSTVILELGSGDGSTKHFGEKYTLHSVEHNAKYLNAHSQSNYIFAPLKGIWYDVDIVKKAISSLNYDLIIVDGPPRDGRFGFVQNYNIFKQDVPIIIDDYHRSVEQKMVEILISQYNKKIINKTDTSSCKQFVVLKNQ